MGNQEFDCKLKRDFLNIGDMALKRRALCIINGLELKDGDRVLDVGCGDGFYLHLLLSSDMNLDLYGTDFDEEGLKKAKDNLKGKVKLFKGDLMKKLPYKDNMFDKIVMSEVAEHLPDDVKGLKEARRVLKPGGILCLTVPNHNYPFLWDPVNWILEYLLNTHIKSGFFAGLWNQHERLYKPKEIKIAVEKAGFKNLNLKSLTYWCLPFNHYIVNMVARGLAAGIFTPNVKDSLNKFSESQKKPFLIHTAFRAVNVIDKLNDLYQPKNQGVSIFVKAVKQ